jgi:uncharacterized protein Usg
MHLVTSDFEKMLQDYRLTTAQIFYHLPDHPAFLQWFLWQHLDVAPDFPELKRFLDFWERSIDGKLHSVRVSRCDHLSPSDFVYADGQFLLH